MADASALSDDDSIMEVHVKPPTQDGEFMVTAAALQVLRAAQPLLKQMAPRNDGVTLADPAQLPAGLDASSVEAQAALLASLSTSHRHAAVKVRAVPVHDQKYACKPRFGFRVDAACDMTAGDVIMLYEGELKTGGEVDEEQYLHSQSLDYLFDTCVDGLVIDAGPMPRGGGASSWPRRNYLAGLVNAPQPGAESDANIMAVSAIGAGSCAQLLQAVSGGELARLVASAHEDGDLRVPLIVYVATREITKGEQLLVSYGEEYWCKKKQHAQVKCEEEEHARAAGARCDGGSGSDDENSSSDGEWVPGSSQKRPRPGNAGRVRSRTTAAAGAAKRRRRYAPKLLPVSRAAGIKVPEGLTQLSLVIEDATEADLAAKRAVKLGGGCEGARLLLCADLAVLAEHQAMVALHSRSGFFADMLRYLRLDQSIAGMEKHTDGATKIKAVWREITGQQDIAPTIYYYQLWLADRQACLAAGTPPPYSDELYARVESAIAKDKEHHASKVAMAVAAGASAGAAGALQACASPGAAIAGALNLMAVAADAAAGASAPQPVTSMVLFVTPPVGTSDAAAAAPLAEEEADEYTPAGADSDDGARLGGGGDAVEADDTEADAQALQHARRREAESGAQLTAMAAERVRIETERAAAAAAAEARLAEMAAERQRVETERAAAAAASEARLAEMTAEFNRTEAERAAAAAEAAAAEARITRAKRWAELRASIAADVQMAAACDAEAESFKMAAVAAMKKVAAERVIAALATAKRAESAQRAADALTRATANNAALAAEMAAAASAAGASA